MREMKRVMCQPTTPATRSTVTETGVRRADARQYIRGRIVIANDFGGGLDGYFGHGPFWGAGHLYPLWC